MRTIQTLIARVRADLPITDEELARVDAHLNSIEGRRAVTLGALTLAAAASLGGVALYCALS